jgi:hypothetical protein
MRPGLTTIPRSLKASKVSRSAWALLGPKVTPIPSPDAMASSYSSLEKTGPSSVWPMMLLSLWAEMLETKRYRPAFSFRTAAASRTQEATLAELSMTASHSLPSRAE